MSAAFGDKVGAFCRRYGVAWPCDRRRLKAGRNSEVWHLADGRDQWVLKKYHRHPDDPRDRLGAEFGFLRFLQACGVGQVPLPIGADRDLGAGLYSFLPGARPSRAADAAIDQAAAFIRAVNRHRRAAADAALPAAADACTSTAAHLELVQKRVERFAGGEVATEATAFVSGQIVPHWEKLRARVERALDPEPLGADDLALSPSDFGLHNALADGGALRFVDFEYAGWDDPAKLLCDFACQPEVPVSAAQGRRFMAAAFAERAGAPALIARAERLLPVHRLKWCLIMLNEFTPAGRARRAHAGLDPHDLGPRQLAKARDYFARHCGID